MAWIAIDAGTSVIKVVAYADDGHELAAARNDTEVLKPKIGFSEQDMNKTWATVVATVQRVIGLISEPTRGIVTTAQGDGCWLVDASGAPTGNAILWNDGRASEIVREWHDSGIIDRAFRLSGSVPYAGLPNAIFRWLRDNEPARIESAKFALTCNGWLFSQFTGEFIADISDASNPFSDVRAEKYSADLISLYKAQEFAHLLPEIRTGKDVIAPISIKMAQQLGLSIGTPVVMAPYDIVSTAIGAGATSPGQACLILGTTMCTEMIVSSLSLDLIPCGTTIALGDGKHLRAMPTLTGSESLHWAAEALATNGIHGLASLAASVEPSRDVAFFFPYLSPAGERAPFLDARARGGFQGLTLSHTRSCIARSVYEGLSFSIRECLEKTNAGMLRELRVCGGGAQSDFWCHMIADVTGANVTRTTDVETGARGAHIFALVITGAVSSLEEGIRKYVGTAASFDPIHQSRTLYDERFSLFKQLRELSIPQWHLNAQLR